MGSGVIGTASIDFNPVPDLAGNASLRITTAEISQNNLRVDVNSGLVGTTVVDGDIGSPAGFFSGIAYTNNDRDPGTGTTLYGISRGFLYQVTDPNAGTHMLVGSLGVSGLNSDFLVGFDVSGFSGTAFASLLQTTGTGFYSINLATGAATLLGNINTAGARPHVSGCQPAQRLFRAAQSRSVCCAQPLEQAPVGDRAHLIDQQVGRSAQAGAGIRNQANT